MSDDIVTRLRQQPFTYLIVCKEAADEIERLRELVLLWRDTADALHYDYCVANGNEVLGGETKYRLARDEWDEWEKAVRGD